MTNSTNNNPLILHTQLYHTPKKDLREIRDTLRAGKVIMYPCDTCWALSCVLSSQEGLEKIFAIKQRDPHKTVSLAFADLAQADRYLEISPEARLFLKKHIPERITLILPIKSNMIPPHFPLRDHTVGARFPKDDISRRLAECVGEPIITTSANISGESPVYSWKEVSTFLSSIATKPDIILYKKEHPPTPPSTIIDTTKSPWEIMRQGGFEMR